MAITLDASLGSNSNNGAATVSVTTGAAAAAGSRVVVCASYFSSLGTAPTCTVGGTSATLDKHVPNGSDYYAVFSLVVAGGLATSSTISVTIPGAAGGLLVCACSYLGTTGLDTTTSNTGTTAAAWSTGSIANTVADALFIGGAGNEVNVSTTSTPGVGNERFDIWNSGAGQGMVMQDLITTTTGSQALTGTWSQTTGLTSWTGCLVIYKGTAAAAPARGFLPRTTLGRGVRNLGQIVQFRERATPPPIAQPAAPLIWPPPYTFPSTRNRSFFAVRGHQRQPVPAQETPVLPARAQMLRRAFAVQPRGRRSLPALPQFNPPYPWPNRVSSGRSKFTMLRGGKRWLQPLPQFNPPYPWPTHTSATARKLFALQPRGRRSLPTPGQSDVWPVRVAATRRELFMLARRGARPFPVQPQIPVPPTIPPKLGAPRRLLNTTARGRGWSAAFMVATSPPVLTWPPPKLGAPRRLLSAPARGRRTMPTPAQDMPVIPRRSPRLPRIAATRRGSHRFPTQGQIKVPPTIPGNRWSSGRSRMLFTRRGHATNPVLTQVSTFLPPPCITPPTSAAILAYFSRGAVLGYASKAALNPYSSTGSINAYFGEADIRAYTSSPAIVAYTSRAAVVTYTSTGRIGPTFCP